MLPLFDFDRVCYEEGHPSPRRKHKRYIVYALNMYTILGYGEKTMQNIQSNVIGVSYHLERLLHCEMVHEAVEKKDKESFVKSCKNLRVPKKYWNILAEIVFSVTPNQSWPWGW